MNYRTVKLILFIFLFPGTLLAEESFLVSCEDSPAEAVMEIPSPLNNWVKLVCSKYGHLIDANDGWIWTSPGGYQPVFIPAQMVKENPVESGNAFYFTKISFHKASGKEKELAISHMKTFDGEHESKITYKLVVTNNMQQSQTLYFFDDQREENKWGIWCRNHCKEVSHFMFLDMSKDTEE